jgi:uncharacterized protein YjbI with pentapeptide repeats
VSDEQIPSQPVTTQVTSQEEQTPINAWGQLISPERQTELQGYVDQWQAETDHGKRKGPFDGIRLTGEDVYWLAEQSGRDTSGSVPNLHLEGAILIRAHLERAELVQAHLESAVLLEANLEGANLHATCLKGANLSGSHLEGANLSRAHLERALLCQVHLEGTDLSHAYLTGVFLQWAWLDSKTILNEVKLDRMISLGDIHWGGVGGVNLTQIDWSRVPTLGDEQGLSTRSHIFEHEAAVRAYRQVAAQLRGQGLNEVADRFSERAQICQRKLHFCRLLADWYRPWRLPGDLFSWLFSWFLALLAGYGYHPERSLFCYLAAIFGFAGAYYLVGHTSGIIPGPVDAIVFSLTSFHGRGFFPSERVSLHSPLTILAALEAVIGLIIEISFIATFTQRFFGTK